MKKLVVGDVVQYIEGTTGEALAAGIVVRAHADDGDCDLRVFGQICDRVEQHVSPYGEGSVRGWRWPRPWPFVDNRAGYTETSRVKAKTTRPIDVPDTSNGERWLVGLTSRRTLHVNGQLCGLADTPEIAKQLIDAGNGKRLGKSDVKWRTGRGVFRTIYMDDKLVAVVDTGELARELVDAVIGKSF